MSNRRYPRTSLEAWPTRSPGWLTHYRRPLTDSIASAILAITLGAGLALTLVLELCK